MLSMHCTISVNINVYIPLYSKVIFMDDILEYLKTWRVAVV